DILQPLDKFSFEVIIESDKNYLIYEMSEKLRWKCKIADLKDVQRIQSWSKPNLNKNIFLSELHNYIFFILLSLLPIYGIYKSANSLTNGTVTTSFTLTTKNGNSPVSLKAHDSDRVKVLSGDSNLVIELKDLNETLVIKKNVNNSDHINWTIL